MLLCLIVSYKSYEVKGVIVKTGSSTKQLSKKQNKNKRAATENVCKLRKLRGPGASHPPDREQEQQTVVIVGVTAKLCCCYCADCAARCEYSTTLRCTPLCYTSHPSYILRSPALGRYRKSHAGATLFGSVFKKQRRRKEGTLFCIARTLSKEYSSAECVRGCVRR